MKIGFIGVGNIGGPIAGQLLRAGHALAVHDIRRAAADRLLAGGAAWADSPAALAAECEAVVTCLPGPAEMERVCLGPDGIVAAMRSGALYIDHTTNAPALGSGLNWSSRLGEQRDRRQRGSCGRACRIG
jgi:3-hydroxyisobutyrate dehydrogenase